MRCRAPSVIVLGRGMSRVDDSGETSGSPEADSSNSDRASICPTEDRARVRGVWGSTAKAISGADVPGPSAAPA
jgi:hypothetical protein